MAGMTGATSLRVLVWQWGRFGGAPRFAALLAEGLAEIPGVEAVLSLARDAEILRDHDPPRCDLPVATYRGLAGFAARVIAAPFLLPRLMHRIRALRPTIAV